MQQFTSFFIANWPLFLALAIILFMLARSYAGGARSVPPMEALRLINHENALVLDVRTDKEFNEGHIINSMHIPLGMLSGNLHRLSPYRTSVIVVVCRSGARSSQALAQLRKAGFDNVYNLSGGILAWQNANMPLTTEKGRPPRPGRPADETSPAGDEPAAVEDSSDAAEATVAGDEKDVKHEADAKRGEDAVRDGEETTGPEVVIYTGRFCPYCARALKLLKDKGVAYTELSVDGDPALRREMTEKAGASSVPQIFVDGRHIGDCDGIHALDAQGRLDELLGIGKND